MKFGAKYSDKVSFYTREKDAFPGKSAVLNEALEKTKGDVICVFDADARVKPDFLKKILPYLSDKDTGAVQARKVIINKNSNFLTRCQNNEYALDTHFQKGRDSIRGAVELRGNGQLIKKEAIIDVNGWNNYTITDDLDLSTRLHLNGWDIRFCIDTQVYEEGILKFTPLLRQRREDGWKAA
ncbi:MAG: glycosyltransferase family 2 protein [Ignavibacteriales bacterium]|nr:glycosyltransferase family 2 protein [Ignavibacteriales bacterium]